MLCAILTKVLSNGTWVEEVYLEGDMMVSWHGNVFCISNPLWWNSIRHVGNEGLCFFPLLLARTSYWKVTLMQSSSNSASCRTRIFLSIIYNHRLNDLPGVGQVTVGFLGHLMFRHLIPCFTSIFTYIFFKLLFYTDTDAIGRKHSNADVTIPHYKRGRHFGV